MLRKSNRTKRQAPAITAIAGACRVGVGLIAFSAFVNIPKTEWAILYFHEDVQDALAEFPAGIQARYVHLTERMIAFGPDLGMPHTRSLGKGLFEMRMKSSEGIGRVFFCTTAHRQIMMLHAFIKKSPKTPARELAIARNRLRKVKANEDA